MSLSCRLSRNELVARSLRAAVLADEAEHVAGDVANLDLLRTFRDAVAAVVTIDVLELLVARISPAAMHLHRPVGGVADEAVAAIVAHRDLVGEIELNLRSRHAIHLPSRAIDQPARHLRIGLQFDQRPLDRLVARERLAERLPRVGVVDALVDAVLRRADARGRLADA